MYSGIVRAALACVLALVGTAWAQTQFTFSPANPTASDSVTVTVVDNWVGVCPQKVSIGQGLVTPPNNTIHVFATVVDPPQPGNCVLTSAFVLGALAANTYTIEYEVVGGSSQNIFRTVTSTVTILPPPPTTVRFSPATPGASDNVTVTVVDNWVGVCPTQTNSGPGAPAPNNLIRLFVVILDVPQPGNCVLTNTFALGALAAGTYTIEYDVYGGSSLMIYRTVTSPLIVSAAVTPNAIPAMSPFGMVLLALILVGIGYFAKRSHRGRKES